MAPSLNRSNGGNLTQGQADAEGNYTFGIKVHDRESGDTDPESGAVPEKSARLVGLNLVLPLDIHMSFHLVLHVLYSSGHTQSFHLVLHAC